jgi:glutathione S-transferase
MDHVYTAGVTLLALLFYFVLIGQVGQARRKYGVKAPAVTGNEHYERAYRVQMNTIEQMVFFLPSMWLCALFVSDIGAAIGGLIWIAARILYAISYTRDPTTRGPGALLTVVAAAGLFVSAAFGVLKVLF